MQYMHFKTYTIFLNQLKYFKILKKRDPNEVSPF